MNVGEIFIAIGIVALTVLVGIPLAIRILRGSSLKAKVAGQEIELGGKTAESLADATPQTVIAPADPEIQRLLSDLEGSLSIVYDEACQVVRVEMVRVLGVPKDALSSNGDFQFIDALLWQAIYGKNGKKSVRTILEDAILHKRFESSSKIMNQIIEDRNEFLTSAVRHINAETQRVFEAKYHSKYDVYNPVSGENTTHSRIISRERLAELLRGYTSDGILSMLESLFY